MREWSILFKDSRLNLFCGFMQRLFMLDIKDVKSQGFCVFFDTIHYLNVSTTVSVFFVR
jgi:hypothetical protein